MTKIAVPHIVEISPIELKVDRGDLVLLKRKLSRHIGRKSRNASEIGLLGVFVDFQNIVIILNNAYILRASSKIGGIDVPHIEKSKEEPRYCNRIGGDNCEMYVGKQNILGAIKNWSGFESHYEWISRLEKPYIR